MRNLMRIFLVEYLQNFPILLGLMLALNDSAWTIRLFWMGVGAFATALLIAATEPLKLGKPVEQRPADLGFNFISFFGAGLLYLGYNGLIRSHINNPLASDVIAGVLLGFFVGIFQALLVDERRVTWQALVHTGGLALASGAVLVLVGAFGTTAPPFITAAGLCLLLTLVLVRIDYWPLVTAEHRFIRPR